MNYSKNKKIVISNHTDKFIEWIDIVYEYGYSKDNIIIYDRTDNDPFAFCPAANFVVPRNLIKRYSKNLYKKKMMDYTNNSNNPEESHMFERIMEWMWSGTLVERID